MLRGAIGLLDYTNVHSSQIALDTQYWTIFNHITIWGSVVSYFVLDYFYNYVIGGPYVGSLTQAMKEATFWFTTIICVIVLMVPVLSARFYVVDVRPSLVDKVCVFLDSIEIVFTTSAPAQIRLKHRLAQIRSRQSNDVLRTPSARPSRRSLRSGYAFAHQEGFGRLITSGKIMRKLPQDFAFPLGLGSKKHTATHAISDSAAADQKQNAPNGPGPSGSGGGGGGVVGGGDNSPRAPCQDLDTINL